MFLSGFNRCRDCLVILVCGDPHGCPGLQIGSFACCSVTGHLGVLGDCVTVLLAGIACRREFVTRHADDGAFVGIG